SGVPAAPTPQAPPSSSVGEPSATHACWDAGLKPRPALSAKWRACRDCCAAKETTQASQPAQRISVVERSGGATVGPRRDCREGGLAQIAPKAAGGRCPHRIGTSRRG